jgi:hypothetical protein
MKEVAGKEKKVEGGGSSGEELGRGGEPPRNKLGQECTTSITTSSTSIEYTLEFLYSYGSQ